MTDARATVESWSSRLINLPMNNMFVRQIRGNTKARGEDSLSISKFKVLGRKFVVGHIFQDLSKTSCFFFHNDQLPNDKFYSSH